jgi:hypothetical protein
MREAVYSWAAIYEDLRGRRSQMWHLNHNRFDPAKIYYKQYVTKFLLSQGRKNLATRLFLPD